SAIALIALGLGLVMPYLLRCLLLWPAPGCAPKPEWPCSTPPDGPLYRADKALAWHLRRAAPQTDSGCETGSPWADRSGSADRPRSAASLSACRDRTTASPPIAPSYRDAPGRPTPCPPPRARPPRRDTAATPSRQCSPPR